MLRFRKAWVALSATTGAILSVSIVLARADIPQCAIEIIAHRGASYVAPENTLTAVELAWRSGANVEVDIHITKDNRIVAIHDGNTRRTAGVPNRIEKTPYPVLRRLDVGGFKGDAFKGERIPLLSEILALLPKHRRIFIDVKSGKQILPHLEKTIDKSDKRKQVAIIAFSLDVAAAAKQRMPDVAVYWLRPSQKISDKSRTIPHNLKWIDAAQKRGLDGLDVHYAGVTKQFVDAVKASGLTVYVWTVDDPRKTRELGRMGVDGITTNRPRYIMKRMNRHRTPSVREIAVGATSEKRNSTTSPSPGYWFYRM